MRHEEAVMNFQAPRSAIDASLSSLAITGDELGLLPGNRDVQLARARLLQDLYSKGLPTRQLESWHYTDLRARLTVAPRLLSTADAGDLAPVVPGSIVLRVNDTSRDERAGIDGISVRNYRDALEDGSATAGPVAREADDAIGRINGALVDGGVQVDVAAGARLGLPIELQMRGSSHSRFTVAVQAGARASVIERHAGRDEAHGRFVTAVSELHVGKGADVTWIIIGQQSASDSYLGQLRFVLEQEAKLRLLVLNTGGKLVRQELHGRQSGEAAQLILNGINLLKGAGHTDVTMTLEHEAVGTTSAVVVRNVVFDQASGVFQGGIKVWPGAQQTDARMACNTLLLSDDGDFSAKPELEIFADDVQCGHGATVADLDDTQVYYLMARGIRKARARSLLIKGFLGELLLPIENERIAAALEQIITVWLEARG
jgi:Fe-S cluster assembly protein SufD